MKRAGAIALVAALVVALAAQARPSRGERLAAAPAAGASLPAREMPLRPAPQASASRRALYATARERVVVGRSVLGRPIRALALGDPPSARRILVVGCIHGNECAGRAVIQALARAPAPAGVQLWLVPDVNPDGSAAGSRQNARGVDLNRNFPHRWRRSARGIYYSGARALSEPESRAVTRLVARIRPRASVWFHQSLRLVNLSTGVDEAVVRRYARLVGLPARRLPSYRGTVAGWQNTRFPETNAFVVELAAGPLATAGVRRHVRAVRRLAAAAGATRVAPPARRRAGTRSRAPARPGDAAARPRSAARSQAQSRPPIVSRPIPFPIERKRQMRRYARRHYGLDSHLLRRPRVVVEHYTDGPTFRSAFETFAANARDPELRELPGVCAHFVVDRDGTIYQLVPMRLMCRHTIGLNHVAVGVEHVGGSDAEVMGRPPQLRASVRLTRWLQARHGIRTRDVIGHAESLTSPFHAERVARIRNRTHGDFAAPAMRRYRRLLTGG